MPARGTKTSAKPVSLRAFGRLVGVKLSSVQKAIKSGRLRESVRDGKIVDVALADREWKAGASKPHNAGNGGGQRPRERVLSGTSEANGGGSAHVWSRKPRGTLVDAQLRLSDQRAISLELANRRKRGEVLDAAEVERDHFQAARTLRDRILNVPDSLGELAPAVRARIRDELRLALGDVADELAGE